MSLGPTVRKAHMGMHENPHASACRFVLGMPYRTSDVKKTPILDTNQEEV